MGRKFKDYFLCGRRKTKHDEKPYTKEEEKSEGNCSIEERKSDGNFSIQYSENRDKEQGNNRQAIKVYKVNIINAKSVSLGAKVIMKKKEHSDSSSDCDSDIESDSDSESDSESDVNSAVVKASTPVNKTENGRLVTFNQVSGKDMPDDFPNIKSESLETAPKRELTDNDSRAEIVDKDGHSMNGQTSINDKSSIVINRSRASESLSESNSTSDAQLFGSHGGQDNLSALSGMGPIEDGSQNLEPGKSSGVNDHRNKDQSFSVNTMPSDAGNGDTDQATQEEENSKGEDDVDQDVEVYNTANPSNGRPQNGAASDYMNQDQRSSKSVNTMISGAGNGDTDQATEEEENRSREDDVELDAEVYNDPNTSNGGPQNSEQIDESKEKKVVDGDFVYVVIDKMSDCGKDSMSKNYGIAMTPESNNETKIEMGHEIGNTGRSVANDLAKVAIQYLTQYAEKAM